MNDILSNRSGNYSPSGSSYLNGEWRSEKLNPEPLKTEGEIEYKFNPKECASEFISKHFSILINTKVELDFLKDVELNVYHDYKVNGLHKPRQLMNLLNEYKIGDGWSCNPQRGNSVAAFKLVSFGPGNLTPVKYQMNSVSPLVAIIEVDTFNGKEVIGLTVR